VPAIARDKQYVIGTNNHNGNTSPVTISIVDRLKHTHIIGATGTGKSTLIAQLIAQDATAGIGLALFDPHGDLIDDVIAQLPEQRLSDVVLIDPSDGDFPIGLNLLQAHNDIEKEILSSDLVASFRRLSTSWGDQMNAVLGNAILAMLESSQSTSLHDLRRFLIEKEYRNQLLHTITDPSVLYYWQKEFPLLKSGSIGPILTRLDTFLRPRTIRNMIIQPTGLDFETLINSDKIILIKLSQGLVGTENSYLLGSLILSKIHQAAFARQGTETRSPFFVYLDEFQNIITPSIKEMLSGVRKYNIGLTVSHQDLQQLQREDSELLNSVLGNVYTRIVFRVGEPDAKRLQDGFTTFDAGDLQNLGRGEAVVRVEQPQYDCSLDTIAVVPPEPEIRHRHLSLVREHSRKLYATPRQDVEARLVTRLDSDLPTESSKIKVTAPEPVRKPPVEKPLPDLQAIPEDIPPPPPKRELTTHQYLQTLIEKMAQVRGYRATIEAPIPTGDGSVDILLKRAGATIAIEICITTDAEWEMHNISKCITAGYTTVISVSGDLRQLEKIRAACKTGIADFDTHTVLFFTPDMLFQYLDKEEVAIPSAENTSKGYRIKVSYDAISEKDMHRKRTAIAQVVVNSLKRLRRDS
jgi:hypothetical protein